jgi:UDP-glucose 4-epimerase
MADVTGVIHAATLHKPHVATHSQQDFVETNITGTLALLEAAVAAGVHSFVFTSTTSAFGAALTPAPGEPAAWVTETVAPIPKNIYGVTKIAAEGLCELHHRRDRLPVIVLRTSRFFPEADDDAAMRACYSAENVQANELLHRRLDIADVVDVHLLALDKAPTLGFGRYIVSATTPFVPGDLAALRQDAAAVVERRYPGCAALYAARGWSLFPQIDRVYVNAAARTDLGWQPRHDFAQMLGALREGRDFRSALARAIGSKGYHATGFEAGPYRVSG